MSGLRLTPENLASAYTFLRTTHPFCKWRLPEAGAVKFAVIKTAKMHGDWAIINGQHRIRVSEGSVAHTDTLMASMAHEMIHIRCYVRGDKSDHGEMFQRYARQVCKFHGFDPKLF